MRKLSLAALFLSSGCGAFSGGWEGIWFVEAPPMDPSACVTTGDENFENAEFPSDDEEVPTGGWTYTVESTGSAAAFFVEVIEGKGDQVFVVIGDEVFPGTAEKKLLQVEWSSTTDELFSSEHDQGYLYSESEVSETLERLTLVEPKKGQATGTIQYTRTSVTEWNESDRWRLTDVAIYTSQMPDTEWLVGNRSENLVDSLECADDDCFLQIETACDGQVDLKASFAGPNENGVFSGIEDVGQDPGGTTVTF